MKLVYKIRIAIYCVAIFGFCYSCSQGEDFGKLATQAFFPPDIVPHPNPPWNQPSGPGEPKVA